MVSSPETKPQVFYDLILRLQRFAIVENFRRREEQKKDKKY